MVVRHGAIEGGDDVVARRRKRKDAIERPEDVRRDVAGDEEGRDDEEGRRVTRWARVDNRSPRTLGASAAPGAGAGDQFVEAALVAVRFSISAWAAASLAMATRKGEQLT